MDLVTMRRAFLDSPIYREMAKRVEEGFVQDSDAKRHHFVPQFLLRKFATTIEGKDLLYQLDKRTGTPRRVPVQEAASRHRFYTVVDDDGHRHNRVEAYLALVEGYAAPAVQRFLEEPELLGDTDAATISHHLALLLARTPAGSRRVANGVDTAMRLLMTTQFADQDAFARTYSDLFKDDDPVKAEQLRQRMIDGLRDGSIAFEDMKDVGLQYGFQGATSIAQKIFQMPWTLLRASESEFITSDTGLAMFDPHPRHPWTGNSLMSSPHAQTTIPLTPTDCLLLEPTEPTGERSLVEVGQAQVDAVNLRTYGWADRHIFGSSQEPVSSVRALARRSPGLVPTPRPPRQVVLLDAQAGDDRLVKEHIARGWPAQFEVDGRVCDYVVVDDQEHPVEHSLKTHELIKRRAHSRQSPAEDTLVPVQSADAQVHAKTGKPPPRSNTERKQRKRRR